MHKKKQHHEEHPDETWLIPYADMLTLLLALFIVMFAMSKVDQEKMEKLAEQFSVIFSGGSGFMEKEGNSFIPMDKKGVSNNTAIPTSTAKATDSKKSKASIEDDQMNDIKKSIEKEINKKGYADNVKLVLNGEGLEVSIQDVVLFNSGDAEIKKDVYPLLLEITKIIMNLDNSIRIVGHTDNIPIKTSKFRSNWDLSAFRAINVMNFMIDKGKMSSKRLSIQAYGEYKPKFDNSTADGRAKNRRVEIFIVRNYPLPDDNSQNEEQNSNTKRVMP